MTDNSKKVYWRGYEELTNDLEFVKNSDQEFNLPSETEKGMFSDRRRAFPKNSFFFNFIFFLNYLFYK